MAKDITVIPKDLWFDIIIPELNYREINALLRTSAYFVKLLEGYINQAKYKGDKATILINHQVKEVFVLDKEVIENKEVDCMLRLLYCFAIADPSSIVLKTRLLQVAPLYKPRVFIQYKEWEQEKIEKFLKDEGRNTTNHLSIEFDVSLLENLEKLLENKEVFDNIHSFSVELVRDGQFELVDSEVKSLKLMAPKISYFSCDVTNRKLSDIKGYIHPKHQIPNIALYDTNNYMNYEQTNILELEYLDVLLHESVRNFSVLLTNYLLSKEAIRRLKEYFQKERRSLKSFELNAGFISEKSADLTLMFPYYINALFNNLAKNTKCHTLMFSINFIDNNTIQSLKSLISSAKQLSNFEISNVSFNDLDICANLLQTSGQHIKFLQISFSSQAMSISTHITIDSEARHFFDKMQGHPATITFACDDPINKAEVEEFAKVYNNELERVKIKIPNLCLK